MNKKSILAAAMTAALTACGGGGSGFTTGGTLGVGGSGGGTSGGGGASVSSCTDSFTMTTPVNVGGTMQSNMQGRRCTDLTLDANVQYLLTGNVFIGGGDSMLTSAAEVQAVIDEGATLTVPAGSDIRGFPGTSIVVTRGASIEANGTRDNPITFSSSDDGFDGQQQWGGLVIQGFAQQFSPNSVACNMGSTICNVQGEGGDFIGFFGGENAADDSGTLRYVRIAEGGAPTADAGNEINGLTLQGVGHGTDIEFIQVHNNRDDGIEWFGGTVNIKYAVLTNNDDDDIDFDEGYQGNIQYALVIKQQDSSAPVGSNDPRAIEANSSNAASVPETEAVLSNITIIGGPAARAAGEDALRLRGDVRVDLYNTVVDNYDDCLRAEDGVNTNTRLTFMNVIGDCVDNYLSTNSNAAATPVFAGSNSGDTDGASADAGQAGGAVTNGGQGIIFDSGFGVTDDVAVFSSAVAPTAINNGSGFTFDATAFAGAVDPALAAAFNPAAPGANDGTGAGVWWAVWTLPGSVDLATLGSPNNAIATELGNINN